MKMIRSFLTTVKGIVVLSVIVFVPLTGKELGKGIVTLISDQGLLAGPEIDLHSSWHQNDLHGFSFDTPKAMSKIDMDIPAGYEDTFNEINMYTMFRRGLNVIYVHTDVNLGGYDVLTGIETVLTHFIGELKGSTPQLNFEGTEEYPDDIIASGTFFKGEKMMRVKAYMYWNGYGETAMLAAIIPDAENSEALLDRIIESRDVHF